MNDELKEMFRSILKEELAPVNKRLDGIETSLETIEKKIDGISNQVAKNSEQLTMLTESQNRQEKILETLALRSIEHETELRNLRRA